MSSEEQKTIPKESRQGDAHTADFGEHKIDVYKLIHLSGALEKETVPISELEKFKYNNYWKDANNNWLGPQQILDEVNKYQGNPDWNEIITNHPEWEDEIKKILKADYKKHPIIIVEGIVIDGMHRLTKAWIDKVDIVEVKRFQKLPEETIMTEY